MKIFTFIYLITMGILLLIDSLDIKKEQQQQIKLIRIAATFAWIGFYANQVLPN